MRNSVLLLFTWSSFAAGQGVTSGTGTQPQTVQSAQIYQPSPRDTASEFRQQLDVDTAALAVAHADAANRTLSRE